MFDSITYSRLNASGKLELAGKANVFSVNHYAKKMRRRAKKFLSNNPYEVVVYGMKVYDKFDDKINTTFCMIPMSRDDFKLRFDTLKDLELLYVDKECIA